MLSLNERSLKTVILRDVLPTFLTEGRRVVESKKHNTLPFGLLHKVPLGRVVDAFLYFGLFLCLYCHRKLGPPSKARL